MAATHKTKNGDPPEKRTDFRLNIASREEVTASLKRLGIELSEKLISRLKIPSIVRPSSLNKYEFFDTSSSQPAELGDPDSPLFCVQNKMPPPSWIKEWYLAVLDDNGEKQFIFAYNPKRVFVKCKASEAEEIIGMEMWRNSVSSP